MQFILNGYDGKFEAQKSTRWQPSSLRGGKELGYKCARKFILKPEATRNEIKHGPKAFIRNATVTNNNKTYVQVMKLKFD